MVNFLKIFAFIVVFSKTLFLLSVSNAASPISQVGGSDIEEGELSIESRFGLQNDKRQNDYDNYFQMRHHIDYGFSDWYAFRSIAFFDKKDDKNTKYHETGLENRFQIFRSKKNGWDGGFRLNYYLNNSKKNANKARFSILSSFSFWQFFEFRNNIIFDKETGSKSNGGIYLTIRNQISHKLYIDSDYVKINTLSLAIFSDLNKMNKIGTYDEQEHEVRLINVIKLKNDLNLSLGYGVGISRSSSDRNISLSAGKDF